MSNQVSLKHTDVTDKILHAFFKIVYPQLGYGFLEKVYENAMLIALKDLGMEARSQAKIEVYFREPGGRILRRLVGGRNCAGGA